MIRFIAIVVFVMEWKGSIAFRTSVGRTTRMSRRCSAAEETVELEDLPAKMLESEGNIDYIPLATMLMTGDFRGADDFTRDALIRLAGEGAVERKFVYFHEVAKIPGKDLATIENLWIKYSNEKFGYSVQKGIWEKCKGDFDKFCKRVDWVISDQDGFERKRRWFGDNEFIYDLEKGTKGHLPLTNTLRGTTLFKAMMNHPVWESDWRIQE